MLTIILKGTNGCNLACSYCSLGKKTNITIPNQEKIYAIMKYACEIAKYRKENNISFILHGGEPTLIPTKSYRFAINGILNEFPKLNIEFSMQTNGFYIDDDMIQFFKDYSISVGVSVDGGEKIHDLERRTVNQNSSFSIVKRNIEKLAAEGIPISCLMVLTSVGLKEDFSYLDFFEKNHLHLKINPLLNYGEVYDNPELSIEKGEYAEYLIRLYKYIIRFKKQVNVSPIDKILYAIVHQHAINECTFSNDCNEHFLCIDYNGNIYPCGKFADMKEFCLGNIADANLDLMNNSLMRILFQRRNENKPLRCKECKYMNLCNAGCSGEAMINRSIIGETGLCEDYKALFDFFHKEGLILLKKELIRQKEILRGETQ